MKLSKYLYILPLLMQPIFSDDWPGFGGVNGNFISSENKLRKLGEIKNPKNYGTIKSALVFRQSLNQKVSLSLKDTQMAKIIYTVLM